LRGSKAYGATLTALPAVMQYSFLLTPLLSSLSAVRMYLIAAGSAVKTCVYTVAFIRRDNNVIKITVNYFSNNLSSII
jgi:hypothetical protein